MNPRIYAHAGIHMHRNDTVGTEALIVRCRTLQPTEVQEQNKIKRTHIQTRLLGSQQPVLQGAERSVLSRLNKQEEIKTIQR